MNLKAREAEGSCPVACVRNSATLRSARAFGRGSQGRAVAIVAQLVRASVCGTEGRGFKSRRSPHFLRLIGPSQTMNTPWGFEDFDAHENLHFVWNEECGLKAIVAIHSTHLGPAGGGCRFWQYADPADALTDALRLSRGMSYKNAM